MDRPEPGLIKWSPNASRDSFLHLNLQHRVVQLYEPTGHAQRGRFDYQKISKHDEVPPLTTYDWSPSIPGLVAVGTSTGVVNLLRVDDNSNDYKELIPKVARTCLAVAFNTTGLLAVGMDRVRNDPCLHIWDVNRLAAIHNSGPGFSAVAELERDPWKRLEHNASISSIKFFEDNPRTLVVGIKGSGLRIHDLREGSESVINFQTKYNNNLTIDYADQNFFASSGLDSPGIMVWDRRALNRSVASASYLDALDSDDMPLGGALRLDQAMEMERDPQARSARNSFIRKIAYCRDQRGMLAVLSRTGQLKVFSTQRFDNVPVDLESDSPELLQVRRSSEMDNFFSEPDRKHERIVSFDWLTMPSPSLRPRILVLRNNGTLDILEVPSATRAYPFKLTPWQAPYRGSIEDGGYHSLMSFEPPQTIETLGPFYVENTLSNIPIFGPDRVDAEAIAENALQTCPSADDLLVDEVASHVPLPESFHNATNVADKLKALREYKQAILPAAKNNDALRRSYDQRDLGKTQHNGQEILLKPSSRYLHESLLKSTLDTAGFPKAAQVILDHVMLLRAKEKYLFDCRTNRAVIADDPWLKGVWGWIENAEEACMDGGMIAHSLDLSYLGVNSIWTEDLGEHPNSRISEGAGAPDRTTWTRCISAICKKRDLPRFDGVETRKSYHRALLLDICKWGAFAVMEDNVAEGGMENTGSGKVAGWYTMTTAHALFKGDSQEAVRILKEGSKAHSELLFVSLALQLVSRGDRSEAAEQLDFDEAVAAKTDPYLRAISSFIATGDWAVIARQRSLPLRDRTFVAVRNFDDDQLTDWLASEMAEAVREGDIEGIVLAGISERTADILATYIDKFHDVQTATLVMSFCAPRFVDDHRCAAWRAAYRAYLQRHKAFYQRTKFEVESTKRSTRRDGRPALKTPSRQVALRCVYCDAETSLLRSASSATLMGGGAAPQTTTTATIPGPFGPRPSASGGSSGGGGSGGHAPTTPSYSSSGGGGGGDNKMASSGGIACPNCKRHLPRCVVCLEVVGIPRSSSSSSSSDAPAVVEATRMATRFPTFCLRCEHVLHLDHARQWFARHNECPVPECRCRCNFRANPELSYH